MYLTDRWRLNPCQGFIESVVCVTGYSCERQFPPEAGQTGVGTDLPPRGTKGAPDTLTHQPLVLRGKAKFSDRNGRV